MNLQPVNPNYLPQIIGVNGRAQHGKDTIAQILHDLYGYERVAFADVLKAVARDSQAQIPAATARGFWPIKEYVDAVGWEDAKKNTAVRELLQGIGVAARQHIHENVWVDAAFVNAPKGLIVISDMRFPNEFQAVKHRGGRVWRVHRPGVENVNEHVSETALDNHIFDQYIENDGTVEDLAQSVIRLVELARFSNQNMVNHTHNQGIRA